jgi:hypothetical protein
MHKCNKNKDSSILINSAFKALLNEYKGFIPIYIDGSKTKTSVAAAAVMNNKIEKCVYQRVHPFTQLN